MPPAIRHEVESLFQSNDRLLEFIEDRCEIHPTHTVEVAALWREYQSWAGNDSQFRRANDFSRDLLKRDAIEPARIRRGDGKVVRGLSGIGIKEGLRNE